MRRLDKMMIFDGFWGVGFMGCFVLVRHRLRRTTTHSLKASLHTAS